MFNIMKEVYQYCTTCKTETHWILKNKVVSCQVCKKKKIKL